jgi:hypothetical protein
MKVGKMTTDEFTIKRYERMYKSFYSSKEYEAIEKVDNYKPKLDPKVRFATQFRRKQII